MRRRFDVVVVGAGAIGLSISWRLAQRGFSVAIAADLPGSDTHAAPASQVAAGMLAPTTEAWFGEDALLTLGLESFRMYPSMLAELHALTGTDLASTVEGSIYLAQDRDAQDGLARLYGLQTSLGLEVSVLDRGQLKELSPATASSVRSGLLACDETEVDPRALVRCLTQAALQNGAEMLGVRVEAIEAGGSGFELRLTDGTSVAADRVVIAAGCWSGQIVGGPPELASIRPVKGQILRLQSGRGPVPFRHILRSNEVYIVPRSSGEVIVGATVEEQGFDTTVTAGAMFELLRSASEIVPAIREMQVVEFKAGLRPGTPDNRPLIGPTSMPGVIAATGHYRNGILLTPITAGIVAELVETGSVPESLAAFDPLRFVA